MARIFILDDKDSKPDTENEINYRFKGIDEDKANAELEKDELLLRNDLAGLFKVGGKKHSKGGTPSNLNDGDFIFSNDKSLSINENEKRFFELKTGGSRKKKDNTPAKVVNQNVPIRDYNTMVSVLEDDKYDDISKQSAALMLEKYIESLGKVAYIQESRKSEVPPMFAEASLPVFDDQLSEAMDQSEQYKYGGKYVPKFQGPNISSTFRDRIFTPNPPSPEQVGADNIGYWNEFVRRLRRFGSNGPSVLPPNTPEVATGVWPFSDPLDQFPGTTRPQRRWPFEGPLTQFPGLPRYSMRPETEPVVTTTTQNRDTSLDWATTSEMTGDATPQRPVTTPPSLYQRRTNPFTNKTVVKEDTNPVINPGPQPGGGPAPIVRPYRPNVPLSPMQNLNLLYSGMQALTVPRFYPMRPQITSPTIELERQDPQAALNAVNNAAYSAYENVRTLNPTVAAANASSIFGKSLDATQQVVGNYNNINSQIANQEATLNNQIQRGDLSANVAANQQFYDRLQRLNQNYADETRLARNQTFGLFNQFQSENEQLYNFLLGQTPTSTPVLNADGTPLIENGRPVLQESRLFDLDPNNQGWFRGIRNTGTGDIMAATGSANAQDRLQSIYDRAFDAAVQRGVTQDRAAILAEQRVKSAVASMPKNKYGGQIKRMRK